MAPTPRFLHPSARGAMPPEIGPRGSSPSPCQTGGRWPRADGRLRRAGDRGAVSWKLVPGWGTGSGSLRVEPHPRVELRAIAATSAGYGQRLNCRRLRKVARCACLPSTRTPRGSHAHVVRQRRARRPLQREVALSAAQVEIGEGAGVIAGVGAGDEQEGEIGRRGWPSVPTSTTAGRPRGPR